MYAVRNSQRALFVALIPLAAVHAVLLAMALLETQTVPPEASLPAPDKVLMLYVARLALDGTLLWAGHLILRRRAISSRLAYALMGGAMTAFSYAIALRNGLLLSAPRHGSEITAGLLPMLAGMIAGFLYGQFAGLAPAAAWPAASLEGLMTSQTFDGPIRVRTSVAAIVIAATIPAVLTGILSFMLTSLFFASWPTTTAAPIFAVALPAQLFLMTLIATIVPSALFVLATHHVARALGRSRGFEYAVLGSLMAGLCCVLFARFTPIASVAFLLVPGLVYGAIMGALYRRFAGLEPLPLPEAVLASDENALVAADHPSRLRHGVVFTE
jgi:hypothetical protein